MVLVKLEGNFLEILQNKQFQDTRDLKVDGSQSNLYVMFKQLFVLINFAGAILWWTNHVIVTYSNLCIAATFET